MTHRARKPYIAGNWKMNLDRAKCLDMIEFSKEMDEWSESY